MGQHDGPLQMIVIKLSKQIPIRATEWLLAGILFSWGIACLNVPDQVWHGPSYSGLRNIAGQMSWGLFASMIGFSRLVALFINGAFRRSPHARAIGAGLSVFLWLQLSLAMFGSEIQAIAIAIYPWLFLADIFNVYRSAQDARASDMRAQAARESRGANPDAAAPAP